MMHWLNHQSQAFQSVLARMRQNIAATLMICLVIGVTMCLPSLFYLGLDGLSKLSNHLHQETEISVFLKLEASKNTVDEIDALLAKNSQIQAYHFVGKDEAWQQLKSKANNTANEVINQLEKNPLPDAFFIQAKSTDPEALEALRSELQNTPGVAQALLNADWAKRLASLLSLSKMLIIFISLLLAIVLLVIIGNTIRMQILTQKEEIEVSYLIGATHRFIRTPFLYAGLLYGLFGALLAILMMTGMVLAFNYAIASLSHLYNSDFQLPLMHSKLYLTLICTAMFIGLAGAYFAVTRTLEKIVKAQTSL
ncbi:MAG: ABC transporter permease [Methylotenera sp.]|nr:ABC transporter permease [Methylotenera sp.]